MHLLTHHLTLHLLIKFFHCNAIASQRRKVFEKMCGVLWCWWKKDCARLSQSKKRVKAACDSFQFGKTAVVNMCCDGQDGRGTGSERCFVGPGWRGGLLALYMNGELDCGTRRVLRAMLLVTYTVSFLSQFKYFYTVYVCVRLMYRARLCLIFVCCLPTLSWADAECCMGASRDHRNYM